MFVYVYVCIKKELSKTHNLLVCRFSAFKSIRQWQFSELLYCSMIYMLMFI